MRTLFPDESPAAVKRATQRHKEHLEFERERTKRRIAELELHLQKIEGELQAPDEEPERRKSSRISPDRVMYLAGSLEKFTIGEMSGHLGASYAGAYAHVRTLVDQGVIVETDRRFGRKKVFELARPVVEVEVKPQECPEIKERRGLLGDLPLPLQHQAKRAIENGWRLGRSSDGSPQLNRKGHVSVEIPVRSKNAAKEARKLRQRLKGSRDQYLRSRRSEAV